MIPNNPQHAVWYSLPNGWGLHGKNTHPGQVHRLSQIDIDSSRHKAHAALKIVCMCLFHFEIKSQICQNLSRNDGGCLRVNRNADVIAKNHRRDMYRLKVNNKMPFASSSARPCRRFPEVVGQFHVARHQQHHPNVTQQLPQGCPHRIRHE